MQGKGSFSLGVIHMLYGLEFNLAMKTIQAKEPPESFCLQTLFLGSFLSRNFFARLITT